MRTDITGQNRNVAEIIIHPSYNRTTFDNDVALIRLTAPLAFNARVGPIQLTDDAAHANTGITGRVTGWGLTSSGNNATPANQLQTLDMPIISRSQANNIFTGSPVNGNMIALYQPGTGVAPGDSGGPLTVVSDGARYLIGASSFGQAPQEDFPTVYTRLFNYRAWIQGRIPLPTLTGPDCACSNANETITLNNGNAAVVNWASSTNITPISDNNTQFVFRGRSGSRGNGWVTATFNGNVYRYELWIGQPNPPSRISGPTTVQSGAIVNYSSTVAPGATGYEWWAPYPFTTVTNFNYFSRNWQVRRTTSRYMTAVTGTQGADGLIQVMGTNKCGRGGAKTLSVRHSTGGGGGGGAIPLRVNLDFDDALTEDSVFPNPVNSFLNIYLKDKESYGSIRYTLTAMDGKTVYDEIDNGKNGIDTSLFTDGQYILSIITDKGIQTKHIIINH